VKRITIRHTTAYNYAEILAHSAENVFVNRKMFLFVVQAFHELPGPAHPSPKAAKELNRDNLKWDPTIAR